jgi:chaperonin cofactor prefoldin
MSQLDSELNTLRIRIATLEGQKRIESEERKCPMKELEGLIEANRNISPGSNKFQNERYLRSRVKLSFLQPILDVLKNINERLEVLEKRG